MRVSILVAAAITFIYPQLAMAQGSLSDAVLKGLGESAGTFGRQVGEEALGTWIQVEPQSKKACLAKTGNVVNKTYWRCRNGYQALLRKQGDNVIVVQYRDLPE